jgi:hypothetical protein
MPGIEIRVKSRVAKVLVAAVAMGAAYTYFPSHQEHQEPVGPRPEQGEWGVPPDELPSVLVEIDDFCDGYASNFKSRPLLYHKEKAKCWEMFHRANKQIPTHKY